MEKSRGNRIPKEIINIGYCLLTSSTTSCYDVIIERTQAGAREHELHYRQQLQEPEA
jgi:hypothetical protein